MRNAFIAIMRAPLYGCGVPRVSMDSIRPQAEFASRVPINARLLVYIPTFEANKKTLLRMYTREHLHRSGEDLKTATLDVAHKYFKDVSEFTLDKKAHYVLKVGGDARLETFLDVYKLIIHAELYNS